ncbi:MAG: hypothetical protein CM1200mP41_03760 [Gammaproteobacteria bacterium]|nr:MAG: hypothetical protein CM1200mP41_03760 [Gammaproteobacteria bacterium]
MIITSAYTTATSALFWGGANTAGLCLANEEHPLFLPLAPAAKPNGFRDDRAQKSGLAIYNGDFNPAAVFITAAFSPIALHRGHSSNQRSGDLG